MSTLKNKVITITGAASGMGYTTAHHLSKTHNAHLSLADLQLDKLQALESELKSSNPDTKVLIQQVDVSKSNKVDAWIAATVSHFAQPIYGAANLAGILPKTAMTPMGTIRELEDEEFEMTMAVNCRGILNCVRAQLRNMQKVEKGVEGGGGSIVNCASHAGLVGYDGNASYSISKFGVVGITKCAAKEEGRNGIRVNGIAP